MILDVGCTLSGWTLLEDCDVSSGIAVAKRATVKTDSRKFPCQLFLRSLFLSKNTEAKEIDLATVKNKTEWNPRWGHHHPRFSISHISISVKLDSMKNNNKTKQKETMLDDVLVDFMRVLVFFVCHNQLGTYLPLQATTEKRPTWQPSKTSSGQLQRRSSKKKQQQNIEKKGMNSGFPKCRLQPFRFTSADRTHTWLSPILTYGRLGRGRRRGTTTFKKKGGKYIFRMLSALG